MKDKSISLIISMVSIFVLMHYFFTLDIFSRYLRDYNLNIVSIFSWEDVQFSIASINSQLFTQIPSLLLGPFVIVKLFKAIHKKKIGFETNKRKDNRKFYIGFTVAIVFTFIVILCIFVSRTVIILFVLVILATIAYCYYRDFTTILLIYVFLSAKVIYDDVLKKGEQLYGNNIKIELIDGQTIMSDSINKLVFFGTKYIILENDSPNVKLYPTDRVVEIEWINKRMPNQTDTIKATLK